MLSTWLQHLSPTAKAHIILLFGVLLLLNSFNMVCGLHIVMTIAAILLIWDGLIEAGYWAWLKEKVQKLTK